MLESAQRFSQNVEENAEKKWNKEAAFFLHQAAESFYHCVLLVRSLYSRKTHALNRLRALCVGLDTPSGGGLAEGPASSAGPTSR